MKPPSKKAQRAALVERDRLLALAKEQLTGYELAEQQVRISKHHLKQMVGLSQYRKWYPEEFTNER